MSFRKMQQRVRIALVAGLLSGVIASANAADKALLDVLRKTVYHLYQFFIAGLLPLQGFLLHVNTLEDFHFRAGKPSF